MSTPPPAVGQARVENNLGAQTPHDGVSHCRATVVDFGRSRKRASAPPQAVQVKGRIAPVATRKSRNKTLGVFFLRTFSFAPRVSKEKRLTNKIAFVSKGEPPTCAVPLFQAASGLKFTLPWRFLTIRNFAVCGRRPNTQSVGG